MHSSLLSIALIISLLLALLFPLHNSCAVYAATPTVASTQVLPSQKQDDVELFPPTVSISNIDEGAFYNRDIVPRITIKSRNLRASTVALDGAPYVNESPIATEGRHTITISAEDHSGLKSSLTISFVIDKTPPTTSIKASDSVKGESGLLFATGKASLAVSAIDNGVAASGISNTECQIDAGPWQTYNRPYSLAGLSDGTHSIICRSFDNAGNQEEDRKLTIAVGNSPPTTVLTLSQPHRFLADGKFMASPDTTLTLFASGSQSGIAGTSYQIDNGPWQVASPFSIQAEGTHTIRFKSIDRLGNEEEPKSAIVTIDKKPPMTELLPQGQVFTRGNNTLYGPADTVFKLATATSVIGIAKTEYRIDNRGWLPYEPFSISEEGRHLIEFRSIDEVGNIEPTRSRIVFVDSSPPLTVASLDGKKISSDTVQFTTGKNSLTINAEDFLSGVKTIEYRIDGGRWQSYAPLELTTPATRRIEYRSTDNVGNREEIRGFTLKADNAPPVSTIEAAAPKARIRDSLYVSNRTVLTITAADLGSGIAKTEYRVDKGEWKKAAPFTLDTPGSHEIESRSVDSVGNEEVPHSLHVTVDITPPVTIVSSRGQKGFNSGTVNTTSSTPLTLSVHSPVWGARSTEYRLNNGIWAPYHQPFTIDEEGRHILEFRSTDKGGNEEPVRAVDVVVDDTPPVSAITIGSPLREVDRTMQVEAGTLLTPTAVDHLSGVAKVEYQIKGQSIESDSVPFSIATIGTYEIAHWSIDKAGNREAAKKVTLKVTAAPKRFSAEDLLLSNELSSPSDEKEEKEMVQLPPDKIEVAAAPPLPEPPPDERMPPAQPPKERNPVMQWTLNFLQALLIIGVMLF